MKMFSAIVNKMVDQWTDSKIISETDRDVYVYGLDLVLSSVLNLLTMIATAALCRKLPETLILMAVVVPLQAFGGGYHADTHLRCFLIMFIGWWCVMPLMALITPVIATVMICASLAVIFIFAPVPHVNVPLSEKRRQKMRRIARMLGTGSAGLSLAMLWAFSDYTYAGTAMAAGLGVIAFSMLCAWGKRLLCGCGLYSRKQE